MKTPHLPKYVDPYKAIEQSVAVSGELLLSTLPRLQEITDQKDAKAEVSLKFQEDRYSRKVALGHYKANPWVICQRCLEPMQIELEGDISLALIKNDEKSKDLPENYDPLVIKGEKIFISDIIGDEILLALPMVPKHGVEHEDENCINRDK